MTPIITTAPLGAIPAGSYGVQIDPVRIFIGGAGIQVTTDFRPLDEAEIGELTHVLPFLFADMIEEYGKESK